MFSVEHLHQIRDHELRVLAGYLKPGAAVLELGGGTGYQAGELSKLGFQVKTIDVPDSAHRKARVYPVTEYDGRTIPFDDGRFDVVLSSNVLEHVRDLPTTLRETKRVLRPDGYCVHAMPSPAWRFWTSASGPLDAPAFVLAEARRWVVAPCQTSPMDLCVFAKGLVARFAPIAHGDRGNALTELRTFGRKYWTAQFERHGFEVVSAVPIRLFYTGWSVLGSRWSLESRGRATSLFGSASYVYEVRPRR